MRSKGEFELFHKRMWTKPSVLELTADARLLYIWSWTHPGAALSGLYSCSPRELERALGPGSTREHVRDALEELARKPLLLYDDEEEVIFVVGRVEHVLRTEAMAIRMRREWAECPPSPLKDRFVELHGQRLAIKEGDGRAIDHAR